MASDTERLRRLADVPGDAPEASEASEADMSLLATGELRQLLEAATELSTNLGDDVQPPYDSTMPEGPELGLMLVGELTQSSADGTIPSADDAGEQVAGDEDNVGFDPYNHG